MTPKSPSTEPEKPIRKPEHDGVYPRCVWCGGENYAMAVIAYSKGEIPCASVNNCGKFLPKDYIKLDAPQAAKEVA